jgi:FAD:protein FMN transferase
MYRIALLIFTAIFFNSCSVDIRPEAHGFNGEALGTTYMVRFYTDNEFDFENVMDSLVDVINSSMSTYITKSDISRINRGENEIQVDDHFVKVFSASKKIFKETKGYFDPTVGVLVNAYGFGPGETINELDGTTLDSLKQFIGLDKIKLEEGNIIVKQHPSVYLDFNAIAKGYTIDVIAEYLESKNVENYLIELGGELRAKGKNLENDAAWIVGIDDPEQEDGERKLKAKVKLLNAAMATSGNYRKFRTDSVTGRRYVHTINPLTGKAEKSNLLSASVIADNCMMADGYATAFMALGLEKTRNLLKDLEGVEAYILYSTVNGEMKIYSTPGFKKLLVD